MPTMAGIKCPKCGHIFEPSEAYRHELEDAIKKSTEERHRKELELLKIQAIEETERRLKAQTQKDLKKAEKDKELLEEKLEKEIQEREDFQKRAMEKAAKEAVNKNRLEKLEYEKKLRDMQKALDDAQRKAKQGSQQLQGEVLELDLEEKLKNAFPSDEFLPIPKGVEGGDIWQKVKFNGKVVGSILWETKRTKAWSKGWLAKLKDDAARVSATESIIVSQVLPEDSKNFDRKDGIWITTYEHAIGIARFVRFLITAVASVKSSASQTGEDWGKIRDYMLSETFKHRMQAHFDSVKTLRDILESEKRTAMARWVKQQKQIEKLDSNTVTFYAELKDIVSNLPELDELETPLLADGADEQETLI